MTQTLNVFIYLCLCARCASGVLSQHHLSWQPCKFTDERLFRLNKTHFDGEFRHRDSLLQFGKKGDTPVKPHMVTFLVTGSKSILQQYMVARPGKVDCEIRRYQPEKNTIPWPVGEPHKFNTWFRCTLNHSRKTVVFFLRLPSLQIPPDHHRNWPVISDGDVLTTTVAMAMKTESPVVHKGLHTPATLNCQFAVDHKTPKFSVEWILQRFGERLTLFRNGSSTGERAGTAVVLKTLSGGDVSYEIPYTKVNLEGTYICSVSVPPLSGSLDVSLQILQAPRVSLNVVKSLTVQEGSKHTFSCLAEKYYPLDVEFVWTESDPAAPDSRVGAPLPKTLKNVLLSSHTRKNETYKLSASFYLQASLEHSGKNFTCTVNHKSLRYPIKKSFILTVEEPSSWFFFFIVGVIVLLSGLLYHMVPYLFSSRWRLNHRKRY